MDETSEFFTTFNWPCDKPILIAKSGKMYTR